MAIEYLTGLNAIVMKAIWNIEKRQGRVTIDRKSTRLNSSHITRSRMPSSA